VCPIAFSLRARSQCNTHWESVHEFPEGKAAHQEVLELRCRKPYICPFHHGEPQDSFALQSIRIRTVRLLTLRNLRGIGSHWSCRSPLRTSPSLNVPNVAGKVSGSRQGKVCMEGHPIIPVYLVEFDCVDVTVHCFAIARFGRENKSSSTEGGSIAVIVQGNLTLGSDVWSHRAKCPKRGPRGSRPLTLEGI